MQHEVNKFTNFVLPPRHNLFRFIQSYFKSFHRHQPFLHEPTWSPVEVPTPLVLAVCANGALYCLERDTAFSLYRAAVAMVKTDNQELWMLQTTMLLIAFAAWSGDNEDLRLALQLQSRLALDLPQMWARFGSTLDFSEQDWQTWRELESMKR